MAGGRQTVFPNPMLSRAILAAAVLTAGTFGSHLLQSSAIRPPLQSLASFPASVGSWRGADVQLDTSLIETLRADDILNRDYARSASADSVELFVAYYGGQRWDNAIHSPKNCIPETGWEPLLARRIPVSLAAHRRDAISEYLIARGPDRRLVLYWYQAQGRVAAGEFEARFRLLQNALIRRRTDGAVVRLTTSAWDGEAAARARAIGLAQAIYPLLCNYLPD